MPSSSRVFASSLPSWLRPRAPRLRFTLSPCHFVTLSLLLLAASAHAAETQTIYLSGKGKDDPIKWDFMCSAGQHSGAWSTIAVPSNWELQGFGIYTYGTDRRNPWPKVTGHYKRTFITPVEWRDLKTFIVFEGVMTDAQVSINGQSAGPMHQGGYYRFRYDITKLLKPAGEDNLLEITVDDESAEPSINRAERRGDYWNYGGIYRPVYLEALPATAIDHVAIDARADGTLNADFQLTFGQLGAELVLKAQVYDADGKPFGPPLDAAIAGDTAHLSVKLPNAKLWTAETPNLYTLEAQIGTGPISFHTVHQKFGFRTLEARPGEGLFLNGQRIMLKGSDRHVFWPDSGRCTSEALSRADVAIMKDMNMNAVRCSHYPPDQHFLDACDELGIYVLDELAGWHQAYNTPTGTRLVQEMVTRDVNHPSIVFWDNGNEGGWNNALDTEFAKYDPQKRAVLHPQQTRNGIDNSHYPQYNAVVTKSNGPNVFFPTEFLHGLYDGGAGAGLEDYWKVMLDGKASAGGFIWAFLDEDVVRTDKGGILDSNGNQAPDGILGPYREKEGSFYTIKQVWSPIIITRTGNLDFRVENRYAFINANECKYSLEFRDFKIPNQPDAGYTAGPSGTASVESIPPGTSGKLAPMMRGSYDLSSGAIAITAKDPVGRQLWTWVWPLSEGSLHRNLRTLLSAPAPVRITSTESPETLTASVADLSLTFSKKSGLLTAASRNTQSFSLNNGPRLVSAVPPPPPAPRGARANSQPAAASAQLPMTNDQLPPTSFTQKQDGTDLLIAASYDNSPMKSISYRLRPNGWLTIDYVYKLTGPHSYFGVGFDYPEANVQSMRYLGNGPAPVYQNRTAGGTLDVWEKKYNNTIVGDPDDLKPGEHFDYPIFKGYYAGVRWLQLNTTEGPITALIHQEDLFVQVFTPKTPPANIIGQTRVPFPSAGISFLHAIPAIGSKFTGPTTTGPHGQPAIAAGDYKGSISLYFGQLAK